MTAFSIAWGWFQAIVNWRSLTKSWMAAYDSCWSGLHVSQQNPIHTSLQVPCILNVVSFHQLIHYEVLNWLWEVSHGRGSAAVLR